MTADETPELAADELAAVSQEPGRRDCFCGAGASRHRRGTGYYCKREQPAPTAREIPADELAEAERVRIAEKIADAMGHERFDDAPECPDADGTMGCQHGGHPDLPGCDACGEIGWPCEPALRAAEAVLDVLGRERDVARAEVERLRTDVLAALHAEGDPVRAASFVREVADKLATELSQADEFGRGEFRVTQDAYDQAVKQLERLRARDEKAAAVVQAVRRYGLLSDAARAALDALARAYKDGAQDR